MGRRSRFADRRVIVRKAMKFRTIGNRRSSFRSRRRAGHLIAQSAPT
jgi:hypothetical protein